MVEAGEVCSSGGTASAAVVGASGFGLVSNCPISTTIGSAALHSLSATNPELN